VIGAEDLGREAACERGAQTVAVARAQWKTPHVTIFTRLLLPGMIGLLLSCAAIGPFVWVDDYVPPPEPAEAGAGYRIAPGDLISVSVYNQEGLSARERVRGDGMISLPLLRDVRAAGLTPNALAEHVQARLKDFINKPVVSVAVAEPSRLSVPILGEVIRPGQYALENGAGVLEALAAAGGLNEAASRDRIFVLRREPSFVRIRCSYEALSHGQGRAAALRLRPGDSIVVD